MHSVDVEKVGLPSPLLAEGQFVDCVISARFGFCKKFKSRRRQLQLHQFTLSFPPVKQRQITTCFTLLRLPYNMLFLTPSTSKQF